MAATVVYLSLQATQQGQASYAHVHEIIAGLERGEWRVPLHEPSYPPDRPAGARRRLWGVLVTQAAAAARVVRRPAAVYIRQHPLAVPTAFLARLVRVPVVQEVNGVIEDLYEAWPSARRLHRLLSWLQRMQWRWAAAVVAVTPGLGEYVSAMSGATSVTVITNGANTDLFRPDAASDCPHDRPYAAFVGSFSTWQGIHTMLAAVELREWPDGIDLVLVGDGPESEAVTRAAETNDAVVYLGRLPYAEVAGILANSLCSLVIKEDVSQYSTVGFSPLKLYEAAAAGTAVIASDMPGLRDFVLGSECGLIVPPAAPLDVALAVRELAADPQTTAAMGDRGHREVLANHSWAQKAAETADVLSSVTGASPAGVSR